MNRLFVAWRSGASDKSTGWYPVGRLEHEDGVFRFCYTQGARTPGFQPFFGMTDLNAVYTSSELFPLFANRLLSSKRSEYEEFLRWSGFDPGTQPDPLAVLAVTEGRRQTDQIEVFPCPAPDADGCYFNKFFLHGVSWMPPAALERIRRLQPGEPLLLMVDLFNSADPFAVALRTDAERTMIGYVPRYLARDVHQVMGQCHPEFIKINVDRVNLDAPMQQRVLCRITSCWPEEFQPCSHEAFLPIPAAVPVHSVS